MISKKLKELSEKIEKLAREVKFIQYSTSKISGVEFVQLMSIIMFSTGETKTLEEQCKDLKNEFNIDITTVSLSNKQNKIEASEFLKKVYTLLLKDNIEVVVENNDIFNQFENVYLEDSSIIKFYKIKSDFFKGYGGAKNSSSFKLNLIFNIAKMSIKNMTMYKYNKSDQGLSQYTADHLNKGDLYMADLGYYVLKGFQKIEDKEAFYLSRFQIHTNVYWEEDSAESFDLINYLDKQESSVIDISNVYLGAKEKLQCRMIAYRLPQEVASERIRKKKLEYKRRKGKAPTKKLLASLNYAIFITNIPKEKVSAEMIGTLYKIRWQIELIFKEFKSLMKIDSISGKKDESVNTLIYGKLIMILLVTDIKRVVSLYAKKVKRELSFVKIIKHLKYKQNLENAILNDTILELLEEIEQNIVKYCKTERKRRTSRQLLEENIGFLESLEMAKPLKVA
jgi:hypothetical protein